MVQLVYQGFIKSKQYGENDEALFIGGVEGKANYFLTNENPIAESIENQISGQQVSVRYWLSDTEKTKEEIHENFLKNLFGAVDAEYYDTYSECTGYLWTTERLKIGGHDLLGELRSNIGKFIYLEIDVH